MSVDLQAIEVEARSAADDLVAARAQSEQSHRARLAERLAGRPARFAKLDQNQKMLHYLARWGGDFAQVAAILLDPSIDPGVPCSFEAGLLKEAQLERLPIDQTWI